MRKLLLLAALISYMAVAQDETDTCYGIGNDCVAWKIEKDFNEETRALFARFGYIKFAEKWEEVHYIVQVQVTNAILQQYGQEYFLKAITGQADPTDLRTRVILQVLGNYNPGGSADLSERIQADSQQELEMGATYNGVDVNRLVFVRGKLVSYGSNNRAVLDLGRDRYIAVNVHSLWR